MIGLLEEPWWRTPYERDIGPTRVMSCYVCLEQVSRSVASRVLSQALHASRAAEHRRSQSLSEAFIITVEVVEMLW